MFYRLLNRVDKILKPARCYLCKEVKVVFYATEKGLLCRDCKNHEEGEARIKNAIAEVSQDILG